MKAVLLRAPSDILHDDVADPAAERGDLVLKRRAATLRGVDIRIVAGRKTMGVRCPSIIGNEVDEAFAEYIRIPERAL